MRLEDQVCPLHEAMLLSRAGAEQGVSLFRWVMWSGKNPVVWGPDGPPLVPSHEDVGIDTIYGIWDKGVDAPTMSELGEALPHGFTLSRIVEREPDFYWCAMGGPGLHATGSTAAEASARLLLTLMAKRATPYPVCEIRGGRSTEDIQENG